MAGGDDLIDYSKPKKSTPRSKYAEDSSGASVAEEDGNGFANGNGHSNEKDIVDEKGRGYETDRYAESTLLVCSAKMTDLDGLDSSRRSKKSKRSSGSVRSGTSGRSGHSRRSRRRNPPSDVEEAAEEDEDIAEEDDAEGDSDLDGQDFHDDDDFSDDVSEEGPAPEYVALHEHILPTYGNQTFVSKINLFITQSCAFGLSSGIFGVIVVMAFTKFVMGYLTGAHKRPKPEYDEKYYKRELFEEYTTKTEYYALYWGYRVGHCCSQSCTKASDTNAVRRAQGRDRGRFHPEALPHPVGQEAPTARPGRPAPMRLPLQLDCIRRQRRAKLGLLARRARLRRMAGQHPHAIFRATQIL